MKLYAHQQSIVDRAPNRILLAWEGGTGKTLAMLALAEKKQAQRVLIICPKGMKKQWIGKIKEYQLNLHGMVKSKEEFRKDSDKLSPFDCVIIDECHHFSSTTSNMHKSLIKFLKRTQPKYVYAGTGTPYRREPFNLYAIGLILGRQEMTWMQFRSTFYHERYLGRRTIWEKNDDDVSREKLMKFMAGFSDIVRLKDCFDMPEQTYMPVEELGMTDEQVKAADAARLEESNPLVLINVIHQIENGSLKGNEFREDKTYECHKFDRIEELIDEHDKVVIFCRYSAQIRQIFDMVTSKFPDRIVRKIDGSNGEEHYAISRECNDAESCVLIAQISVSAGWEVPDIPVVIYASLSYSYLDFQQSGWRVTRGNNLKPHVFYILSTGKIDNAVYESIMNKKDFDPLLYENI